MLHGSVWPARRAEKTTASPAGVKTNSLSSPKGLEGVSPSKPLVIQVGVPVALPSRPIDWTNRWFWVWSFQVSQ